MIAVLGAGGWGTTLAVHLVRTGHDAWLWGRDAALIADLRARRANAVYLPLSNKLKRIAEAEAQHMELVLEGILSIQAGSNPRVIEQKLLSFLPDKEREALEAERAA